MRDDLRAYVVEHLGDPDAVLVVDETGFLKKGTKSVGVQRQYSGTAGRIENCQIGVFLAYATPAGRAFLDRALYLPQGWADDAARRAEAGVPAGGRVPDQAAAGAGDAGAGARGRGAGGLGDRRRGLRRRPPVAAVAGGAGRAARAGRQADRAARGPPTDRGPGRRSRRPTSSPALPGRRLDAAERGRRGEGAARLRLGAGGDPAAAPTRTGATGCWCAAAWPTRPSWPTTSASARPRRPLAELVRVAGTRWAIEEAFEAAKGEVGLDQYEVRRWDGWYRHITLCLLAHAFLAVTRARAPRAKRGGVADGRPAAADRAGGAAAALPPGLEPPTAAGPALGWSIWRRRHQARARRCHYQTRLTRLREQVRL